jgi:Pregnancy-associated plasma protein-A/Secretion system C-terminal sorting domain
LYPQSGGYLIIIKLSALKKITGPIFLAFSLILLAVSSHAQQAADPLDASSVRHCLTQEALEKAIRDNPAIVDQWRQEGERRYNAYISNQRAMSTNEVQAGEIVIPIVFHLVDISSRLSQISDRDIYDQVEILNRDFNGRKANAYKDLFPAEIAQRVGNVPVKFVLARRTPAGLLTSGIERRVNTTPDHNSIKSLGNGGLDPWDETKYVNVWAGTFSGSEAGLLGIATFPFMTGETQGVVVGLYTLGANACRSYYATYSEGATLAHELGHFLYLWHTFGDQTTCNNADFRLQSGWPLTGASLNDDTPSEKGTDNTKYGNPSMNYSDGCTGLSYGMMYQSFMNYYDDRALFAFSEGQKARIVETINIYRSGLLTSNGATPPGTVTDAFLVSVTPKGGCDQRQFIQNNTPLKATVRNTGTTVLNSVTMTVSVDGAAPVSTVFPLTLASGMDTVLNLAPITASVGAHTVTVGVTLPNGGVDAFTNNDNVNTYVTVLNSSVVTAPVTEGFNSGIPSNWFNHNPNTGSTNSWSWTGTSGANTVGAAAFLNYDINQPGTLDELIMPAIGFGSADSSLLSFKVAHGSYSNNVYDWDGLEVYVSNDGGYSYKMIYKKTGNFLRTIPTVTGNTAFVASPAQQDRWREEQISLSPYIVTGQNLIIKFRNINAYGNNTYLDDISVSAVIRSAAMDVSPTAMINLPDYACNVTAVTPSVTVKNNSAATVSSFTVFYKMDNNALASINWTGTLAAYASVNVQLANMPISIGNHSFLLYTSNPNGVADQFMGNDTIRKAVTIFPVVNAPLKESFEGTAFPPSGWAIGNPDNGITWAKTTNGVRRVNAADSSSAWMRNFVYNGSDKKDELITPIIRYTNADSIFLTFDLSNVPYTYPGNSPLPMDTLEVLLTNDCGATYRTIYKKWGIELNTIGPVGVDHTYEYFAGYFDQVWRRDSVNILPFLGNSSEFQVMFKSTHNQPGNNLFIDNVNVFTENVPDHLKAKGYQIQGNPFVNHMNIWFYQPAYDLRYINIYDATGRMIWTKNYNSVTATNIDVDLTGKPAGVYLVKIGYSDESRNTFDRVIKR